MKKINLKNKFDAVYAAYFLGILFFINYLGGKAEGNMEEAKNNLTTAIIIFIGSSLYVLRKNRYFKKTFSGSETLEWILLGFLLLYILNYFIIKGYNLSVDPNPLIIISIIWSLVSYGIVSVIDKKQKIKDTEE